MHTKTVIRKGRWKGCGGGHLVLAHIEPDRDVAVLLLDQRELGLQLRGVRLGSGGIVASKTHASKMFSRAVDPHRVDRELELQPLALPRVHGCQGRKPPF